MSISKVIIALWNVFINHNGKVYYTFIYCLPTYLTPSISP